jgi:hypothetical protein
MTIEELIDTIQMHLTMSYALPKELPDMQIRNLIQLASGWFYKNYRYAQLKNFWHIPRELIQYEGYNSLMDPQGNRANAHTTSYIDLPCEVQSIFWIYETNRSDMVSVGLYAPNLNVGLGITGQPYLTSYVSSIAELGTYKTVLEGFSAMMDKFNKSTIDFDLSPVTHRLRLTGRIAPNRDLVLETSDNIPLEYLYEEESFQRYCIGKSMMNLGMLLTRFTFQLPQGFNYNADSLITEGKEMFTKVEEEIKAQTTVDFFFMKK